MMIGRYKPTTGPYRFNEARREITAPNDVIMALSHGPVGAWIDVMEEHHANGRLLAASWELHRQLKALMVQMKHTGFIVPPGVLNVLESAVIEDTESEN